MTRSTCGKLVLILMLLLGLALPAQADVTLPASLTIVEDYAFNSNAAMAGHLEIPVGTESIGVRSFLNCTGLTSVTIPDTVKYIGFEAFYGCTGLTGTVYIRADVEVGENAFGNCPNLTVVYQTPEEAALEGLKYTVYADEGYVQITGYTGDLTKLVIPAEIEGYPVTAIGDSAFQHNSTVAEIVLPDTIAEIGAYAFWQCTALEKINLPQGINSLGYGAFAYCSKLQGPFEFVDVENLDRVFLMVNTAQISRYTTLEDGTLVLSEMINPSAELTIPEMVEGKAVTMVGWGAAINCEQLVSVTLPETITAIESYAFGGCTALAQINIPAAVEYIGYNAFGQCAALNAEYHLLDMAVAGDAFEGAPGVKLWVYTTQEDGTLELASCVSNEASITVPAEYDAKKVTAIGQGAFSEMPELQKLTLPEGITTLDYYAVESCGALTELILPESLNSIHYAAIYDCPALTGSYVFCDVEGAADGFTDCPGVTVWSVTSNGDGTCVLEGYEGSLEELSIPGTFAGMQVTSIGDSAFWYATDAKSVTVPEGVTAIGQSAFEGCGAETVTLPSTLKTIGYYAFEDCNKLHTLTLPEGLEDLGYASFRNCTALTGEFFLIDCNQVTGAFSGCDQVTAWGFTTQEDGTLSLSAHFGSSAELTIPGEVNGVKVTSINGYTFSGRTELTSVTLPDSLTSLGYGAFYKCTGLSGTKVFVGVAGAAEAFADCPDVNVYSYAVREDGTLLLDGYAGSETEVVIPSEVNGMKVTSIDGYTFSGRTELTSVTLPDSLTSLGYCAFYKCTGLSGTKVFVGVEGAAEAFVKCPDVTVYSYAVREDGTLLLDGYAGSETDVVIPSAVNGKTVTGLGDEPFEWNETLESVTLPETLNYMDGYAFYGCSALSGEYVFVDVEGADDAFYNAGDEELVVWVYTSNENGGLTLAEHTSMQTAVAIPAEVQGKAVTDIGGSAFWYCDSMTTVEIPESVTQIGRRSFAGCTALTEVDIPASVQTVGKYAFSGCTALKDISFTDSTMIDNFAFEDTQWLTDQAMAVINAVTDADDSDFEKALAIHDWLTQNCHYDLTYYYHSPDAMLIYHTGVCSGYAWTYEWMMQLLDIEVVYVSGYGHTDEGHAWNIVKLDGEWYNVDVTWDDPIPDGSGRRAYCFVTDEFLARDHTWETADYPAATGTRYFQGEDTQQ